MLCVWGSRKDSWRGTVDGGIEPESDAIVYCEVLGWWDVVWWGRLTLCSCTLPRVFWYRS